VTEAIEEKDKSFIQQYLDWMTGWLGNYTLTIIVTVAIVLLLISVFSKRR